MGRALDGFCTVVMICTEADVRALSNSEFSSELNTISLLSLRGFESGASET
jgi:hypothetical protein